MSSLLSDEQIAEALGEMPGWSKDGQSMVRSYEFADFPIAVAAVAEVAAIAEGMDHHPDIDIRWRTVTFRCSTHSAGGLTEADLTLARAIDDVIDAN